MPEAARPVHFTASYDCYDHYLVSRQQLEVLQASPIYSSPSYMCHAMRQEIEIVFLFLESRFLGRLN